MRKDRYRLGVAGLVHDHVWPELEHWAKLSNVEIVAAADSNAPLRKKIRELYHVPHLFENPRTMIEGCDLDILQVCTSNVEAPDVVVAGTEKGLHCVVEKPMAADLSGARQMLVASQRSQALLMINWPNWWVPSLPHAAKLVRQGDIGEPFYAQMRFAHGGPREIGCSQYFSDWLCDPVQNGGGVLMDLCSYGAVSFRHLFGMPHAIQAVARRLIKTDTLGDDNGQVTMIYNKTMALAEGSWCQIPSQKRTVFLGTRGSLWTEGEELWFAKKGARAKKIKIPSLAPVANNGPAYFVSCLQSGAPIRGVFSPQESFDAQFILDWALQSVEQNRTLHLEKANR